MTHQHALNYDGENFELRDKLVQSISSFQIMVYPRCMIVNKTLIPIICDKQHVKPLSNEYLGTTESSIRVKAPGYSYQNVDITTIGISGAL